MPFGVYVARVEGMVTDDVFAVIAEGTRRDILVSLRSGDKAVGELVAELQASQPTISKHLKVLREAELVTMRAQGQKRYYALNTAPLEGIAHWLGAFDVAAADRAPQATTAGPADVLARENAELSPAVVLSGGPQSATDDTVPQQIGRSVGRAATKAADLFANLPKFGRKK